MNSQLLLTFLLNACWQITLLALLAVFASWLLRAMARDYPTSESEMEGIPGVGEKKRAEFGKLFADEISAYLETNSRMSFA